ncbi:hypothetical protein OKW28_005862 [Paraburkholderia sp. 40]
MVRVIYDEQKFTERLQFGDECTAWPHRRASALLYQRFQVRAEGYGVMVTFAYVNAHEWVD